MKIGQVVNAKINGMETTVKILGFRGTGYLVCQWDSNAGEWDKDHPTLVPRNKVWTEDD